MRLRSALLGILAIAGGCARSEPTPALESPDPVIQEILTKYAPSVSMAGDGERGREIFAKSCLHCHRLNGQGHELGPDAAEFKGRSPAQLLIDIVDPSREVKPEYYSVRILTTDGQLIDGMIAREDGTGITLKRAAGESDTVLRSEIQTFKRTKYSVMPEGLEEAFDVQQMADLIAFMRSGGK